MAAAMIAEIRRYLDRRLSAERLKHVLGVRDTAVEIALRNGADPKKAELAALLHDALKWMPNEQLLEICGRGSAPLGEEDLRHPAVWHAFAAAAFAEKRFRAPPDVCQAVQRHTAGAVDMTPLDMTLYTADFCEPGRPYKQAKRVRKAALRDLPQAALATMTFRLQFLLQKGASIHPRTVLARNALMERLQNEANANRAK